ncbi:MAG TPA: hypothetical protein VF473_06170 [Cyclobacteriaceae bacterium]
MGFRRNIILFLLMFGAFEAVAQKYELFRVEQNDVYWSYTYNYTGNADSLRREVVQMLKSKFYTFNVIRNETGYNGELKHYKVDSKRFGRSYYNTPRMYWYGEWTGKFIVEVLDNYYRVTVYALYAENFQPAGNNNRGQRVSTGRYIETVTKKDRTTFKKSEYANLDLMSLSLKAEFDIKKTVKPNK